MYEDFQSFESEEDKELKEARNRMLDWAAVISEEINESILLYHKTEEDQKRLGLDLIPGQFDILIMTIQNVREEPYPIFIEDVRNLTREDLKQRLLATYERIIGPLN